MTRTCPSVARPAPMADGRRGDRAGDAGGNLLWDHLQDQQRDPRPVEAHRVGLQPHRRLGRLALQPLFLMVLRLQSEMAADRDAGLHKRLDDLRPRALELHHVGAGLDEAPRVRHRIRRCVVGRERQVRQDEGPAGAASHRAKVVQDIVERDLALAGRDRAYWCRRCRRPGSCRRRPLPAPARLARRRRSAPRSARSSASCRKNRFVLLMKPAPSIFCVIFRHVDPVD